MTITTTFIFFFLNDTATTEIYTLSLHDALPIYSPARSEVLRVLPTSSTCSANAGCSWWPIACCRARSEEHTSELQSLRHLVCRLLLEKKKKMTKYLHLKLLVYHKFTYNR